MALAKLMAVDRDFCEAHMRLLFTRLANRCGFFFIFCVTAVLAALVANQKDSTARVIRSRT